MGISDAILNFIIDGMEVSAKLLDEDTQDLIICGISVFEKVFDDFVTGTLPVHLIHEVIPMHAEFKEICKVSANGL